MAKFRDFTVGPPPHALLVVVIKARVVEKHGALGENPVLER